MFVFETVLHLNFGTALPPVEDSLRGNQEQHPRDVTRRLYLVCCLPDRTRDGIASILEIVSVRSKSAGGNRAGEGLRWTLVSLGSCSTKSINVKRISSFDFIVTRYRSDR